MKLRFELHGHEFLEEELAGVGDADLADVFAAVARLAVVLELIQVRLAEQAALLAHVHPVGIGDIEEAFLQEASRPVRNHTVAFHLSKAETTVPGPTLGRLPRQDLGRSTTTRVDLVTDHVLQALVEGRTQEDHDF